MPPPKKGYVYSDCSEAMQEIYKTIDGLRKATSSTLASVIVEALDHVSKYGIAQGEQEVKGKTRIYKESHDTDSSVSWAHKPARVRRGRTYRAEKLAKWRSRAGWEPHNIFSPRPNRQWARPTPRVWAKGRVTFRALSRHDRTFDKIIISPKKVGNPDKPDYVCTVRQGDLTVTIDRPYEGTATATLTYSGKIGSTLRLMDALKGTKKRPIIRKALLRAKNNYKKYCAYHLNRNGVIKAS